MGGGGSKTQTTTSTSGVPKWAEGNVKSVLDDVTQQYKAEQAGGPASVVAQMTDQEHAAYQRQAGLANERFNQDSQGMIDDQLKRLQGSQLAGAANTGGLNSARADMARQGALASQAYQLNEADYAAKQQANKELANAGEAYKAQNQANKDASHTSAQRYFGYLGNTGSESTNTAPKSGGK